MWQARERPRYHRGSGLITTVLRVLDPSQHHTKTNPLIVVFAAGVMGYFGIV